MSVSSLGVVSHRSKSEVQARQAKAETKRAKLEAKLLKEQIKAAKRGAK
ncbi:hypothetical protein ACFY00_25645 [Kitasatospora sp. NPDC001540]